MDESKTSLTKQLRAKKFQAPFYTGGSIYISNKANLIFGLCNFTVAVYNVETKEMEAKVVSENEEILSFVVDPSETTIITYSQNQMFRVWSFPDIRCIKHFKAQHSIILDLDLQRNLVSAATSGRSVCIYDYKKGFATHILKGHKGIISKVLFHPIAEKLQVISASVDNTIRIWDLMLNSCVAVLGYSSPCAAFAISRDGNSLYSTHRDRHLIKWSLLSKAKRENIELDEEVEAIQYIRKQKKSYIITFGDKGIARIFDLASKAFTFECMEPSQPFLRCFYVKAKNKLIGITTEQNFVFYDLNFTNEGTPQLDHCNDYTGFHDEILDLVYDNTNNQLVMATNSSLLK